MKDETKQLVMNFRIPADLKRMIEQAARENRRSLTAETVLRLEKSFEETRKAR